MTLPANEKLTQNIYDFIVRQIREEQISPTVREIGQAVGLASISHVAYHLNKLEVRGLITHRPGKARTIRLMSVEVQ